MWTRKNNEICVYKRSDCYMLQDAIIIYIFSFPPENSINKSAIINMQIVFLFVA